MNPGGPLRTRRRHAAAPNQHTQPHHARQSLIGNQNAAPRSTRRHPQRRSTHAMACPAHRITTAQVRAGATPQPALIWTATGTDNLDTLSSNGVPVWYDEDG